MLKQIVNLSESVTDARLREICIEFDAKVYAKVRVADVFEIEGSGIADQLYSFALKSHFDFVITESDDNPIFAVEFDGPGHRSVDAKRRDQLKNELCDHFEFQLLRVNQKYLSPSFSNWDLLRWFCTVWFVKRGWDEAVLEGTIPYEDSIFDPMFVSVVTKSGSRGLELERHARSEFGRLFQAGVIPSHMPEWIVAKDDDGTLRALAWIKVSEVEGVLTETAIQQQRVGDWVQFAIRGVVLSRLEDAVSSVLGSQASSVPVSDIRARAEKFRNDYQMLMALGSGAVGT
jgi:hypothetical protein